MINSRHLQIEAQPRKESASLATDAKVLLAWPVVLCFLYFTVFAAGLAGLQSFGVSALVEQYRVAATAASSSLTAYLVGAAAGILAGGFVATRATRHDLVAAGGLAVNAVAILLVAMGQVPNAALPLALAIAGFASGMVAPSRDLIVRASTPKGATGRVFGFVYSGLDVGSIRHAGVLRLDARPRHAAGRVLHRVRLHRSWPSLPSCSCPGAQSW